MAVKIAKKPRKVLATLTLKVYYDTGGDDEFDPEELLTHNVGASIGDGLLTPNDGPVTVDSYEILTEVKGLGY